MIQRILALSSILILTSSSVWPAALESHETSMKVLRHRESQEWRVVIACLVRALGPSDDQSKKMLEIVEGLGAEIDGATRAASLVEAQSRYQGQVDRLVSRIVSSDDPIEIPDALRGSREVLGDQIFEIEKAILKRAAQMEALLTPAQKAVLAQEDTGKTLMSIAWFRDPVADWMRQLEDFRQLGSEEFEAEVPPFLQESLEGMGRPQALDEALNIVNEARSLSPEDAGTQLQGLAQRFGKLFEDEEPAQAESDDPPPPLTDQIRNYLLDRAMVDVLKARLSSP